MDTSASELPIDKQIQMAVAATRHTRIQTRNGDDFFNASNEEEFLEIHDTHTPAARDSFETACRSYYETYQAAPGLMDSTEPFAYYDQRRYIQLCRQTLLSFHHFFELAIKDFLRAEHPVLASKMTPANIVSLLSGELAEGPNPMSTEFGEAYNRLRAGVAARQGTLAGLGFLSRAQPVLDRLTGLRNQIWHRGKVFLTQPALDKFVCKNLLPLGIEVLSQPLFGGLPEPLLRKGRNGINPLQSLVDLYAGASEPESWRVQLQKETGRVLMNLPHEPLASMPARFRERDQSMAEGYIRTGGYGRELDGEAPGVKDCPLCGHHSLITSVDSEQVEIEVGRDPKTNGPVIDLGETFWAKATGLECLHCKLTLHCDEFDRAEAWAGFDFPALFWEWK